LYTQARVMSFVYISLRCTCLLRATLESLIVAELLLQYKGWSREVAGNYMFKSIIYAYLYYCYILL